MTDLEFLQFHPTTLYVGGADLPQQPLLSEALRGEGAHLVDGDGRRFMVGEHELAELAPRDVVTRASTRAMLAAGTDHVLLDARHLGRQLLETRFPTITARCRQAGIDPVHQPIPTAPAAHYASGGVRTDLWGRTSAAWEATNLLTVATALVTAARLRRETRGCHWREDFDTTDDTWRGHLLAAIDPDGALTDTYQPR